jgi:hypothetical protein
MSMLFPFEETGLDSVDVEELDLRSRAGELCPLEAFLDIAVGVAADVYLAGHPNEIDLGLLF